MTALTLVPSRGAAAGRVGLTVFSIIPPWAIVHAARDRSVEPLIRMGEVAVIEDAPGIIPRDGALYLIEWESPSSIPARLLASDDRPKPRRSRTIVQAGRDDRAGVWWAHPYNRPRDARALAAHARQSGIFVCSDGPYGDEYQLASKLLGPVIGIYEPR